MKERELHLDIIVKENKGSDIPTMVVEQIITLVSKGVLQPGDKLPSELEMTRRFNISRISLREAIKLLEAKGYIMSMGRRGKFIRAVTDLPVSASLNALITTDRSNILKLFEVKKVLICESAALAAIRANDVDLAELNASLEKMMTDRSPETYLDHYRDFFIKLSGASKNGLFSHLSVTLSAPIEKIVLESGYTPATKQELKDTVNLQLKAIISAISSHSPEEARLTVNGHFEHLQETYPL